MSITPDLSAAVKPLWGFQHEAIQLVRAKMREGHHRTVLVLPTGGGKTRTGAEIVRLAVEKAKRVIWLAHRTELIDQTCKTLAEYGLAIGAVAASSAWPIDIHAPVQVCSVQTLLARAHRPPADLIVWDECHHASDSAKEWVSLLEAYVGVPILGLTATPERGDGSGLAPTFTGLVVGATVRQLIALNAEDPNVGLVPCELSRPDTLLQPNTIARHPLDAYREDTPGQQGFIFAKSVDEAQRFADEFCAAGIRAVCIHAKTPDAMRAAALDGFRAGNIKILSNVYIFTEGTDLPMASVCILARGASSAGIYLQMVGRVLRAHPSKRVATLIDLRGISWVHGPPEEDCVYSLDGKGITRAGATCKVCGAPLIAYPCTECDYAPDAGDGAITASEIANVPMVKYARKIAEGPQQRWETLVRWLRSYRMQGKNPKQVFWKWRAVYGVPLDGNEYTRALRAVFESEASRG